MTLEEEYEILGLLQDYVGKRREYIRIRMRREEEKKEKALIKPDKRGKINGALFVETSSVAPYIQEWLDQDELHTQGLLAKIIGVDSSTISKIVRRKGKWTNDVIADAIFQAIGRDDVYRDLKPTRLSRQYQPVAKPPEPPPTQFYEE